MLGLKQKTCAPRKHTPCLLFASPQTPDHAGSYILILAAPIQPHSVQFHRTARIRALSARIVSESCSAICRVFRILLPLLVLLSPLAFAQSCHPRIAAVTRTFTVPFRNVNGVILLDAKVNDKPAVLLLDTGAGLTVLSPDAAAWPSAAVKKRLASRLAVGIDGATHSMGNITATLEVGRTITVTPVAVADLQSFAKALNIKLDGILGQDVLRGFSAVRIDYKSQLITLEE
jgi:Aspartyl protease